MGHRAFHTGERVTGGYDPDTFVLDVFSDIIGHTVLKGFLKAAMVGDRGQPFSFEYFYCLIRGPAGGCCHHDFIYPQFFSPFSGKLQGLIGIVFSGFVKIHGALLPHRNVHS